MTISIVIPNFNGEKLLKKNLPNILSSGADEVFIIDDGSSDKSWETLENYALENKLLKISKHKKNKGFIPTVNALFREAKGDIVEDRIKELVLLYGQGLLNIYKPTNDTEGIDLIVVKNGVYQPLFLQVKSNYKLHGGRNLLVQVGDRTLHPHHTLFVVGAYFNPKELEINDKLIFIPSEIVHKEGQKVKLSGTNTGHRVTVSLKDGSTAKFTEYLVKKTDFVNKLLEKFKEIERYYK